MRRTHPSSPLLGRGLAALASLVLLTAVTACGDDDDSDAVVEESPTTVSPSDSSTPPTSAPETTAPEPTTVVPTTVVPSTDGTASAGGIEHPTAADEVIVSVGYEGGFVPAGTDFVGAPTLLIAGDGTGIVTGPQIMIYPGPLLPNFQQAPVDEADIQDLLGQASDLGLLADVEYPRNDTIADAPDTVVVINANGESFEHRAYALGLDTETDPARANLQEFVDAATALATKVSSAATPYEADTFLIQAQPMTAAEMGSDVEPAVASWPSDASVRLADASECAEVPADEMASLFEQANQATLFDDQGTTYLITAVPQLPGRSC
jgi:hypothetical protein